MSTLLQKVLTDSKARDAEAMNAYMAKIAAVGTPWT